LCFNEWLPPYKGIEMKKFMMTAVALAAMTSVSFAAAGVAEVSGVKGKVLVNLGEGFVAASAATVLTPGVQIMVGEDSAAVISYLGSDCKVEVAPASVTTVAEAAPCVAGQVVGSVDGVFVTPVADIDVAAPAVFPIFPLLIGAGVVGTIGYLVLTEDDEEECVSNCNLLN
jgi:hypothetical protein